MRTMMGPTTNVLAIAFMVTLPSLAWGQAAAPQWPSAPTNVPDKTTLPQTRYGDGVDWAKAIATGAIDPRADPLGERRQVVLDMDVIIPVRASMRDVLFSHRAHTEWLGCGNCHPALFQPQKGSTSMTMVAIAQGKYCGVCHGKVAFPVTDCKRCHSVAKGETTGH